MNTSTPAVVTVTLNPALDLTAMVPALVPGEVNVAQSATLHPAGKGINVARVLRDLGLPVVATGILGRNNAAPFTAMMAEQDIDNRFILEAGDTRVNVKIAESSCRITDLNLPGLAVSSGCWQQLLAEVERLAHRHSLFVLAGSLPRQLPKDAYAVLIRLLRSHGARVLFDSSGEAFSQALSAGPTLVKPNTDELAAWFGAPLPSLPEKAKAARAIMAQGVEQVVVSCGGDGVIWFTADGAWQATPPKVQVVSTVGAGDSLVAGLAAGLAQGLAPEDNLRRATAVAALAVSQIGVGVADPTLLQQQMASVRITPVELPR